MSGESRGGAGRGCGCARRSWLLAELSAVLDLCARDRDRLIELMSLDDEQLLAALAGRRAAELKARYERLGAAEAGAVPVADTALCRHDARYPQALSGPLAPRMLYLTGGAERLAELTERPVVAVLGSRRASDYGMEMARSLGRGLATSGVTVVSRLADGIAAAAHTGALEVGGGAIAVLPGGLAASCPAGRRALYERVKRTGCAISELPHACPARRWAALASERLAVALAAVAVIVEAGATRPELAGARIAQALGRTIAAVPGRATSPLSAGTNALLAQGAAIARGAADVLELLGAGPPPAADAPAPLEPRLRRTLDVVAAGCDTAQKLARTGADHAAALQALSELELPWPARPWRRRPLPATQRAAA